MQLATPGSLPQVSPSQMLRSGDGKMRIDFGNTSMITDPAAMKTILLDHIKKEALTVPLPQGPQLTPPGLPAFPNSPVPPQALSLGKALIDGHEVEGMQYTFQPPALPKPPAMPTTAEVWTSVKTKLPMLTKITGPFGQQICQCKTSTAPEPPPTAFQIPQDYKPVTSLTPPKPPSPR